VEAVTVGAIMLTVGAVTVGTVTLTVAVTVGAAAAVKFRLRLRRRAVTTAGVAAVGMAAVGMVAGKAIGVPSLHALAASLVDDETNTVLLPQLFHFRHRRCPIRDTDGVTEAVLKVGRRIGKYQYRSQLCARLDVAFGSNSDI
jgi:hypothetical protein